MIIRMATSRRRALREQARRVSAAVHGRFPVACRMAVMSRAALSLSSPVMESRRSTGMPAERLAESWRIRRSPPSLNYWIPANNLKAGEKLKTPDGQVAVADGGTVPADHDGWMWDLTVPGN